MSIWVRDWTEADFGAYVEVHGQLGEHSRVEDLRTVFDGRMGDLLVKKCAVLDGAVVGFVECLVPPATNSKNIYVQVLAEHRRKGVGRKLFATADQTLGSSRLVSSCGDDDEAPLAFARGVGFAVVGHGIGLELDLRRIPAPSVDVPDYFRSQTTAELSETDIAAFTRTFQRSFDTAEALDLGWTFDVTELVPHMSEGLWVSAWLDGEPRVLASASRASDGFWFIGFAATDPAYRGRHLARTAKILLHQRIRELGGIRVRTENDEGNAAMLAVNRALGYTTRRGSFRLVRP